MKKYYRKASMFFSACISCSLAFASVGDDYLKGWNDTQKGTPARMGKPTRHRMGHKRG